MHGPSKEDKDLRVEEGEVTEAILPANNGRHHEETTAGQEHCHQQHNDFCMCRCYSVGGEGELGGGRGKEEGGREGQRDEEKESERA